MTKVEANNMNQLGVDNEANVRHYLKQPKFQRQFKKINPMDIANELNEYGSWSHQELANTYMNQVRILWIAAGDIKEGNI